MVTDLAVTLASTWVMAPFAALISTSVKGLPSNNHSFLSVGERSSLAHVQAVVNKQFDHHVFSRHCVP